MNQLLSRLKTHPRLSLAGAAALVIAVILVIVAVVAGGDDDNGDSGLDNPGLVVNRAGGYSITVPEGWDATQEGRLTRIKATNGEASMEIGPGEQLPFDEAAALLYQRVGRNYQPNRGTNFPLTSETQEINGKPAKLLGGTGRNAAGLDIRFLTITIADGPDKNWAISMYVPERADPEQNLPKLTEIAESFTPN